MMHLSKSVRGPEKSRLLVALRVNNKIPLLASRSQAPPGNAMPRGSASPEARGRASGQCVPRQSLGTSEGAKESDMKTSVVIFPFALFGSGGTGRGAELLGDAFREMLADNQRE